MEVSYPSNLAILSNIISSVAMFCAYVMDPYVNNVDYKVMKPTSLDAAAYI